MCHIGRNHFPETNLKIELSKALIVLVGAVQAVSDFLQVADSRGCVQVSGRPAAPANSAQRSAAGTGAAAHTAAGLTEG